MLECEFDQTPRNAQGVKERLDEQGDAWANQHRKSTPRDYYLQDVDAMFGAVFFGHNTGEKVFLEYVPDNYKNRTSKVRSFALVAMFDRKASRWAAFSNYNTVSCALYLWLCRVIGQSQPKQPRFFYVIGGDTPPWTMIEINIETGQEMGQEVRLDSADWTTVWNSLGLTSLRNELARFVQTDNGIAQPHYQSEGF